MLTCSKIALPGYLITEELYIGSRTLVYRAVRKTDQQPVVIKLLKNQHPSFSELVQFRNQYTIAKNLDIPGIIKPNSLEPYGNGYALVMEDFGGRSLRHFADGRSLPLEQFLPIALQLCEILHPLHQQRVIHKDIKPANILIQPETQQVKLIDFSISSLLPRETQEIKDPSGLEGTLAYLSPEQTGRMNRGIDYRSDFYSLGVTFYELLTGRLPFQSRDPMEMLHCHLTEQPPSVCHLNPEIPLMLGEMIHKLMAKNAENRYQSALGLKHDLVTGWTQRQATGNLSRFELGQRDRCDRFLIPEKLYGREPEVEALLESFGRVVQGTAELMLVAGFSGIGKTAVVNEVHKPIVRQRGYFIRGKYDQFNRNMPLSAFVQALRDLMGQLLSESDEQLAQWQNRILAALGESGQVLIEVLPELERVIGSQPPAPELSGSAAQNRFNRLFQQFIGVFAAQAHPLVMFLDDLQWADSASLNLMQVLMSREVGYLLLIGAYRDHEVSPAHPLMLTLGEIEKAAAIVNTLTLAPLTQADVNRLIADTLSCSAELALPLTTLVDQKTRGNPFFTTQFLKALYEDGLICFDGDAGSWQCDVSQVRLLALTDDVVEFMSIQLQKLPEATQNVLKLAACIGNQFDLSTLAIVSEQSETETAAELWKALQEGLVIPQSEVYKFYQTENTQLKTQNSKLKTQNCAYKFLHDRVQQAAYSLIPDDQKQITHLQIGRLLQHATTEREENLFAIANHLNQGASLIEDEQEQQELVQLNLVAGQKAKSATAYGAALNYFNTGISLLRSDRWQRQYDLALALYAGAAESAYLSGEFEPMETFMADILEHASTLLDTVKVYDLQIQAAHAQNQLLEAVQIALKLLKLLGITFPEQPTEQDRSEALTATISLLAGRNPLDLMALPQMTNAYALAALRVLVAVNPCAYISAPALVPLLILEQVKRSVQYGNAPASAFGYACYGMMLCGSGDIDTGHQFGQLALHLFDQFDVKELKASIHGQVYVTVWHWKEPARSTWIPLRNVYQSGLDTGDLTWASIAACVYTQHTYFGGKALTDLSGEVAALSAQLAQIKQEALLNQLRIFQQSVLNLTSSVTKPQELIGEVFNEAQMLPVLEQSNDQLALCYFYVAKLFLGYLFEDLEAAIAAATANEAYIGVATGLFIVPVFYTYNSLAHLAFYAQVAEGEQPRLLEQVAANQKKLKTWADHAPMNYLHKFYLVEAERCRVLGQKAEAIDLYDLAIALATKHEYIQEAAIANELAAKFYLAWGKERIAQEYLIKAYYSYAHWGAKAKIVNLETRYPELLAPILQQKRSALSVNETVFASSTVTSISSSSNSISDALDLATILKASQALSSEIELGKLLSSLLQLIIENAGADKCVLLLQDHSQRDTKGEHLLVKGLAIAGAEPVVLQRIPVDESQDIPLKLIYRVKNRLEPVVLLDATADAESVSDPYFLQQQPKSVLCSPILHQGKLLGIVYLENNLAIGAFTEARMHILNVLCAQATISLENAWLYKREQEKSQALQASLEELQQSELRFKQLFEQSADAILLLSDRNFIDCNQAAVNLFGYAQKEQLCTTHPSQISPEFQPDGESSFDKANAIIAVAQRFGCHQFEWVHQRENGETFWAEVLLTLIPYQGEQVLYSIVRDIGDRKRAEKSLKLTQFAIDHASLPAWRVNSNGQLLYANNAACRDSGYSQAEILERYVWDLNPEFSSASWEKHRQQTKNQGSRTFESCNINKSGDVYPVEVTVNYIELDGEEYHFAFVKNIRDRKQAERQLQESQQLLQLVLNTIPHKVFWKDCNLFYQGSNRAFAEVVGFTPPEIVGKSDYDLPWTTQESDWFRECDQRVVESNMPELGIIETTLQADGTTVWIETSKVPLHNATGTVIGILGIYHDITDRKQAEAALQQAFQEKEYQTRLLQTVLDSTQAWIFAKDQNFRYIMVNRSYAEAIGQTVETMLGKDDLELGFPEELVLGNPEKHIQGFRANDRCALNGETVHNSHDPATLADGSLRIFDTRKNPLYDSGGNIFAMLGFCSDVTERKQAEEQLRDSEAKFRSIVENAQDIIFMLTPEGNFSYLSPSWQDTMGYDLDTTLNQPFAPFMHPDDLPMCLDVFTRLLHGETNIATPEYRVLHRDGSCRWFISNVAAIKDEAGKMLYAVGVSRDNTDRIAAELAIQQKTAALEHTLQELQQAQLQIIQSEKMSALGNLVAGVAHEINNPVGFIAGNLQPALDYVRDTFGLIDLYQQEYSTPSAAIQAEIAAIDLEYVREDLPKLIASMKLGVDRIRSISTSLRTFSRADKDYKVPFNLHEGIDSTILILKHRLKANELRPEIEVVTNYEDIPTIECFPGQLNQVFMNILANAIDALEEANQTRTFADIKATPNWIEIQTQLDDSKKQVIIQIRDNGIGMSDEIKQQVFDHLFTTKAVGKGTGLGLAIAHQIVVEKHGGTIVVNSILSMGTEFVITLPVKANS